MPRTTFDWLFITYSEKNKVIFIELLPFCLHIDLGMKFHGFFKKYHHICEFRLPNIRCVKYDR